MFDSSKFDCESPRVMFACYFQHPSQAEPAFVPLHCLHCNKPETLQHVLLDCSVLHLTGGGVTVHRTGSDFVDWVDSLDILSGNLQSHTNERVPLHFQVEFHSINDSSSFTGSATSFWLPQDKLQIIFRLRMSHTVTC